MEFINPIGRTATQTRAGNGCACFTCNGFISGRNISTTRCTATCQAGNSANAQANVNLGRQRAWGPGC